MEFLRQPHNGRDPQCGSQGLPAEPNHNKGIRERRIVASFGAKGFFTQRAWHAIAATPGVSNIVGEYERILRAQQKSLRATQISLARMVLDEIARRQPQLLIPDGLINGGADDGFRWRGRDVSADFVMYLSRASDFYSTVPPDQVSWIIEIGPGVGLATLAHVALNPGLKGVVNVDIVPVIYVSTQFLKSSPSIEVVDYLAVRGSNEVGVEAGSRPRVYSLPAWMLPRVRGAFDFGFNAYSFQEMEEEVCAAYGGDLMQRLGKGMMLHSAIAGHKPGAGGQKRPVTLAFLKSIFKTAFPKDQEVGGLFCDVYRTQPGQAVLLTK